MDFHSPQSSTTENIYTPLFRVIPCKALSFFEPFYWVWLGWQDFKKAPLHALFYGLPFLAITYFIATLVYMTQNYLLIFVFVSAFMWMSPVLAYGFYDISRQLYQHKTPSLKRSLQCILRNKVATWSFAALLGFYCFFWTQIAGIILFFYPAAHPANFQSLILFYTIGSTVGSVLAFIIFSLSAFSMPLLMERRVSVPTAIASSLNVVLKNPFTSVLWAFIIFLAVITGILTGGIGLAFTLPTIGFGTWHAYRQTLHRQRSHDDHWKFL